MSPESRQRKPGCPGRLSTRRLSLELTNPLIERKKRKRAGLRWPLTQSQEALDVFLQRVGHLLGPGTLRHLPVLAYQELLHPKIKDEIDERGRDERTDGSSSHLKVPPDVCAVGALAEPLVERRSVVAIHLLPKDLHLAAQEGRGESVER